MYRHPPVVRRKSRTLQQLPRKSHPISEPAQDLIFSTHQLSSLLHELSITGTLGRKIVTLPPHHLHSIFFFEKPEQRNFLDSGCFPHLVAYLKHLFPRNKHVRILIAQNQRRFREQSHVVALLQTDCFGIIRRNQKRLYPLFVHRINQNILSSLHDPDKHVWSNPSSTPRLASESASFGACTILIILRSPS